MRSREIKDKPCLDCNALILRESTRCKSCASKGSRTNFWKGGAYARSKLCSCGGVKAPQSSRCKECFSGENHPGWKGNNITYYSLHQWVNAKKGRANKCSKDSSHESTIYHWANISGEYRKDVSDWQELCPSCNFNDGIKIADRFKKGGPYANTV